MLLNEKIEAFRGKKTREIEVSSPMPGMFTKDSGGQSAGDRKGVGEEEGEERMGKREGKRVEGGSGPGCFAHTHTTFSQGCRAHNKFAFLWI